MILKLIRDIVNIEMGKKRKTRQQKIILQLKRKLASQTGEKAFFKAKTEVSQGLISYRTISQPQEDQTSKKNDNTSLSYDPRLVKRDILKTIILSLIVASLELMLYLKIR